VTRRGVKERLDREEMGNDRRFISGLVERWNLLVAILFFAFAVVQFDNIYDDSHAVASLALAWPLFLVIVGVGVAGKKRLAVLFAKILLGGCLVLFLTSLVSPFVILELKRNGGVFRFYFFSAVVIVACGAALKLIVLGERCGEKGQLDTTGQPELFQFPHKGMPGTDNAGDGREVSRYEGQSDD
jgi:hypothetical protein